MLIDTLVGWVSPEAGLRRLQARSALDLAKRYYDAAKPTDADGWRRVGDAGPKGTVQRDHRALRAQGRDLGRNNAYARRMADLYAAYTVGSGLKPQWKDKARREAWETWANSTFADADDQLNFAGLCNLAFRTEFEAGECLIVLMPRSTPAQPGLPPIELRLLEADHLADNKEGGLKNGGSIRQGIEFNRSGRRVAYHILSEHPSEGQRTTRSVRIPAWRVIHLFEASRPGQIRGVSKFATAALKLRDADELIEAGIMTAKVAACLGIVVHGGVPTNIMGQQSETDEPETLEPAAITRLTNGEAVTVVSPPAANGTTEVLRASLQGAAVSVGLDYNRISGDLRGANFSSLRASAVDIKRITAQRQNNIAIPLLCQVVARWFDSFGTTAGLWQGNESPNWTPPKWEPVQPLEDAKADVMEVQAGFSSPQEKVAERGGEFNETLRLNATAKAAMEKEGLSYISIAPPVANPQSEETENDETTDD